MQAATTIKNSKAVVDCDTVAAAPVSEAEALASVVDVAPALTGFDWTLVDLVVVAAESPMPDPLVTVVLLINVVFECVVWL